MKTNTRDRIVKYITDRGQSTVDELVKEFKLSNVAIHKQVKKLVEDEVLERLGRSPKVTYVLKKKRERLEKIELSENELQIINDDYLDISPSGEMSMGWNGFEDWVKRVGQEKQIESLAREYVDMRKKIKRMRNRWGYYNATEKLRETFGEVYLDRLYYLDFYSLPKFGKTKLGKLVMYAKQSQNMKLIELVVGLVRGEVVKLIKLEDITHVAFVPPTVRRKPQFIHELERQLVLGLLRVDLEKRYKGEVPVAQKTLVRLEDRVENALETIHLGEQKKWWNLLIIDDAVGSGATMNEVARKLRRQSSESFGKIIGLGLTGSFKGFEVIREI